MSFKVFLFLAVSSCFSQFNSIAQSQLCFPVSFCGVVPGITLDRDVVKLFGNGFFDEQQGHGGGRSYVNKEQNITLTIVIGMSYYIESIIIKNGLDFPDSVKHKIDSYYSDRFEITDNGSLMTGLGSSEGEIIHAYGKPTVIIEKSDDPDMNDCLIWGYEPEGREDLKPCYYYSGLFFWFRDGKVDTIYISGSEE